MDLIANPNLVSDGMLWVPVNCWIIITGMLLAGAIGYMVGRVTAFHEMQREHK